MCLYTGQKEALFGVFGVFRTTAEARTEKGKGKKIYTGNVKELTELGCKNSEDC